MYRIRSGLTQRQLAELVGFKSLRMVQLWENGTNLPKAENLKRIIEILLEKKIFVAGKERDEIVQFWNSIKGSFEAKLSENFKVYPILDENWLDNLLDSQSKPPVSKSVSEPSQLPFAIPSDAPGNLKTPPSKLYGLEREKEQLKTQLNVIQAQVRLLTLSGPGGVGKTRLSKEVAKELQATAPTSYPDGIWWVDLTPLTDLQQIIQAIISALMPERRQEGDPYEMLKIYLQPKKLLLVLDNCEHLVEAVANLVRNLLSDCPSLQILATSRESLNLIEEQIWPLEGLSVPMHQTFQFLPEHLENSAAVQLFVERARAVKPLFVLNNENTGAVLEICRQLDGLPLPIELAAARVKGLGVEQIARRLQQNLKLLSDGSRANLPHHQTVQAMIDWSYNLLSADEQLLLRRMAVLRGDFSLEAAEAVLGGDAGQGSELLDPDDVLILMLQLVNKSLVVPVHLENNNETRYRLLEMVRQYSQEKLEASGEAAYLSYKHLAFYSDLAEKGYPNYYNQSAKWVDRLEQEFANLRAALTWALATSQAQSQGQTVLELEKVPRPPDELALRLNNGLSRYWYLKNYVSEGQYWMKAFLALEGLAEREDLKSVLARTYFSLGATSYNRDEQPTHYLNLSLRLFEELGDKWFTVATLTNLGRVYSSKGNYAEAKTLLLRSLALLQEIENQYYLGYTLSHLGLVAMYQGNRNEALTFFQKSEAVHRLHNDQYALAYNLLYLGQISRQKQDLPQALSKIEESLLLFRVFDNKQGIADALNDLSIIQYKMQNYRQARLSAEEAVAICKDLADTNTLGYVYNTLAEINKKEGKVAEAHKFGRISLQIRQKSGDNKGIMESLHFFALLAAAQGQWKQYTWIYSAADKLRQQLGVSRDYNNEQAKLVHLDEQASCHLDPTTLERLRIKGETDNLDDVVKQVLDNFEITSPEGM